MRLQIIQLSPRILWRLTALSACMLWAGVQSQAQVPSPSPLSPQLVKLTLIATNQPDNSVEDVRQEDFRVFEDKLPRTIALFSKDLRPVDYALVIDNSGSFKTLLTPVIVASKSLVSNKHPEDEVFIESFVGGDKIERIDAVYLAIEHTIEIKGGLAGRRRAAVLFTDGEDRASYYGSDTLLKLIRENDVQVFVVGILGLLDKEGGMIRESPRVRAERLLNRIAEESGGRVFLPNGVDKLLEATAQIAHDLHFQYSIGFGRESKPGEKGSRKIRVKFADAPGREKLNVITRPGYLVTRPDSPSRAKEKKSP